MTFEVTFEETCLATREEFHRLDQALLTKTAFPGAWRENEVWRWVCRHEVVENPVEIRRERER